MKEWGSKFIKKHGDRVFFLCAAVSMASVFLFIPELTKTGETILIGSAMLLFNKARSPEVKKDGS